MESVQTHSFQQIHRESVAWHSIASTANLSNESAYFIFLESTNSCFMVHRLSLSWILRKTEEKWVPFVLVERFAASTRRMGHFRVTRPKSRTSTGTGTGRVRPHIHTHTQWTNNSSTIQIEFYYYFQLVESISFLYLPISTWRRYVFNETFLCSKFIDLVRRVRFGYERQYGHVWCLLTVTASTFQAQSK